MPSHKPLSDDAPADAINDALLLTTGQDYWRTHDAKALGLRPMRMADGPHGLRIQNDDAPDHLGIERSAPATCFPPAVSVASTWDEALAEDLGRALGAEAKAAGVDIVLGPGLNIKRSPLCGRNFEYHSEDPLLAGIMSGAIARGIQRNGVAACLKHFAANNQEADRFRISANADERTLREIYLRAFQIALRSSGAWAVMTAYSRINGSYCAESSWLLGDVLRGEWGFDGITISDWGGITDPVRSVNAGLDLRMPGRPSDPRVRQAFADGVISPDTLNASIARFHTLAQRVSTPAPQTPPDFAAHHALARRAATAASVLLTNDGTLPLDLQPNMRVAVIGALAKTPRYQGAGSSRVNARGVQSAYDALAARAAALGATVSYAQGYDLTDEAPDPALIDAAARLARESDIALVFLGLPDQFEVEGTDRTTIEITAAQRSLMATLGKTVTPCVVALTNGAVVSTASWRDDANAIIEFWLTGQAHGEAIADVLLGDAEPAGRLSETIPLRLQDTPAYLNFPGQDQNVTYGEGIYVGYRWYDAREMAVDFPFGHGLSYSTFAYSDLSVTPAPRADDAACHVHLRVQNTGTRTGCQVVQIYACDLAPQADVPPQVLAGWQKVWLAPGEAADCTIAITKDTLAHWSAGAKQWVFAGGDYQIRVGASSRDIKLAADVTLAGTPVAAPLTRWSSLGEWFADPIMGSRLKQLFDSRGGVKGRLADLLADASGSGSVLANPLVTLAEFPGVPLGPDDLDMLCDEAAASV